MEPTDGDLEFFDDDNDEDEACRICGAPAEDHGAVTLDV
jgi:hypothetical protein